MGLSGSLLPSQFTYITPSLHPGTAVLRNGFQYTLFTRGEDIRRQPGVTVQTALNNTPNSASFTVDGRAPEPVVGARSEIRDKYDNDRLLFGGINLSVEQAYEGQINQLLWNVSAVDYTWLMNRLRPVGNYVNQSVSDIVKDLIARTAPGFTTAHVQTNLAKVTATIDGSEDLVTVLTKLANAIGGGHWYVDYNMDVHFFHIVPTNLTLPPSAMPAIQSTDHITISQGGAIPAGQVFPAGYYFFRHTFLYSDGSESSFQLISNVLLCSGSNVLQFTGVPRGLDLGTVTCVGRRIYYNEFLPGNAGEAVEKIHGFVQINDNATEAFTTWFGSLGVSDLTHIVPLGSVKTFSTPLVGTPGSPPWTLLSDQAAILNLQGGVSNGVYGSPNDNVVAPPTSTGNISLFTTLPPGWTAGAGIEYTYTASNSNGETTIGPVGSTVLDPSGLKFTAPGNLPSGASFFTLYVSRDGGGSFHSLGAGLGPGQVVLFVTPQSVFDTFPGPPSGNTAVIGVARGWVGFNGVVEMDLGSLLPPAPGGNIVYFASGDVAALLETAVDNLQGRPPVVIFNGHPAGPASGPTGTVDTVNGANFWQGGKYQFKVAVLYRDGSVSFPSPASPTIEKLMINGQGVQGFNLQNVALAAPIGNIDAVARFVYYDLGLSSNPNFSLPGNPSIGSIWPIPFNEPTWATPGGIIIVPDNETTSLSGFSLADLFGAVPGGVDPGAVVGKGNVPYGNAAEQAVSIDPIPIWPNPDGPSLEDGLPPGALTNSNRDLLHEDSGSQPFRRSTDLSQIRNRVNVIGSGSVTTATGNIGDQQVSIADITAFSPHGGTLKYDDPGTGEYVRLGYVGVGGVPGQTVVYLSQTLTKVIPQGVNIANFFRADDVESQKAMSQIELDANGRKTDGVHEYTIVDGTLKALFQLFMRAYAELELFSKPIVTIKYATRDPLSVPGRTVHVDMTFPPCQGDFLIQNVTIDQIHDESDQLLPRYTVTASSTRFELNDLLLQILGGNIGGSTSSAGIVPTATTIAESTTTAIGIPVPTAGRASAWSTLSASLSLGTPGISEIGWISGVAATGTKEGIVDSNGYWYRAHTGTTGGSELRWEFPNGSNGWRAVWNPVIRIHLRMPPEWDSSPTGRVRFWFGMLDRTGGTVNWPDSDTDPSAKGFAIFFSPSVSSNFQLYISDGITAERTDMGIAPVQGGICTLEIGVSLAGTLVTAKVNSAPTTGPLPEGAFTTTGLGGEMRLIGQTSQDRSIDFNAAYGEWSIG